MKKLLMVFGILTVFMGSAFASENKLEGIYGDSINHGLGSYYTSFYSFIGIDYTYFENSETKWGFNAGLIEGNVYSTYNSQTSSWDNSHNRSMFKLSLGGIYKGYESNKFLFTVAPCWSTAIDFSYKGNDTIIYTGPEVKLCASYFFTDRLYASLGLDFFSSVYIWECEDSDYVLDFYMITLPKIGLAYRL